MTIATLIPADCATPSSCGRASATNYDELNRPVRVLGPVFSDPVNGSIRPVTRLVYDNLGNVKEVWAGRTDAAGSSEVIALQMSYLYDDFGRKVKETDALGRFWTFQYDKHGNVTQATDAKSQTTTFTWSYGHQLASRSAGGGTHLTQYTRNPLGQVLSAVSPEVGYTYTYDAANNRLRDVSDSRGNRKLTYSYSAGGLLNTVEQYNGTTLENRTDYVYDAVGRLTGIWAPSLEFASFVYDAGGRMLEKWLPNGVTTRYATTRTTASPRSRTVATRATSSAPTATATTRWAIARRMTDPNGNTTSYQYWGYDGAGPNVKYVKYDGRLKRRDVI